MPMMRLLCVGIALCLLGGCAQFEKTPARYSGLGGQKVGVMVYAARPVKIDFPNVQLDIAKGVQSKLQQSVREMPELKGATFPVRPESISRYQQDNPQIDGMPITRVAPKLGGIERLIYIEVHELQTRSDVSAILYRGRIEASLRVIEVRDGEAEVGYEEISVISAFPPNTRPEGVPNANDYQIYSGTLDAFTTDVATRFFAHYRN